MDFLGRAAERAAVDDLLSQARAGLSGALVVHGEAGIGKTALLEYARGRADASGFRVVSSVGVECETQFAFGGLHQLCAPLLDRMGALPEPQQTALGVAFGQQSGAVPDRFLIGLATLNLLAEAAEEGPLLCLVDDAQWLDEASAQVLTFVARRVAAEPMALVFTLRDPTDRDVRGFDGIPVVRLGGLDEADARELLAAADYVPLDDGMREHVVAEAHGNPLALLELARSAPAAWVVGGFEPVPGITHRIEDTFRRRADSLPAPTRLLLLVAAADPTGEVALLWRAAAHLGIAGESAAPAEAAGLLEIDTRVRFRHPLVRSAVLRSAVPLERRRAHDALAAAIDPDVDPDRRAWHRAQAVLGTDEDAAAGLVRSADRARARGGVAAAAAFMEHAARLTPDPAARASRALEAAQDKHEAGADASELLKIAAAGPLDPLQQARLELLRARIAFHLVRDSIGGGMLLHAARSLAPQDAALSRETYLHALEAAIVTGNFVRGRSIPEVAEAARAAPTPTWPQRPVDLLLDGLVETFTQGYAAGVPGRRRALEAFVHEPDADTVDGANGCRWGWLAIRTAMSVFDDESLRSLAIRNVRVTREAGALATLPAALLGQSIMLVLSGEIARAAEQNASAAATGAVPLLHAQLVLSAWRGHPTETAEAHAAIVRKAAGPAHGTEESLTQYAMSVLHNGLGDYPAAYAAGKRAYDSEAWRFNNMAHSEFIEAACRSGRQDSAAEALEQLSTRALASGTPWGLGLAARARALTSAGPKAEESYREAIEQLGRCRMAAHLARTHLVYGEWLRREGRRQDAREQLRTAHGMLLDMGAEAFAARAARELRATGEHPRKRSAQPADSLTAHEMHIARLVATGATSREVATELFLSPRTIDAHLRNIFRKMGVTSRRQLRELSLR
ncbi:MULTISPECIES: LuxR family transcriptional regulator [unclassified Arthrobacter]|uniref:ATP-binding protein n=1 Tax=unclassified Arthrobacter TaxID=235627 RepID=UPI0024DFECD6|nr:MULTISPECIES: LuxR family transcriptional regulator [unclassified Arthrobacter]MCC9145001.1 AAA family ATPase [Arthrobacter sp. zg-Y919]MDK1276229.1 AAA family ATPase [Arthrobacter sp. zg.Y919]WIB02160.1 AAA family ATPase [Arthrobacter sp. zg-Y919]